MPELETMIRAAAPRPTHAPAHLEWTVWTALAETAPLGDPLFAGPELVVDEPTSYAGPSKLRPLVGIAAVAAALLAAVVIAGLRDRAAHPAAGHRTAPGAAAPKGRNVLRRELVP